MFLYNEITRFYTPEGQHMSTYKHYLQFPTSNHNQLAFVSEDDLWLSDITSLNCRRLTVDFGSIKSPKFSPCGQYIAFSSDREGSIEAYVIATSGGSAQKITFTGNACIVVGWKDKDTVIISSTHDQAFRQGKLYTVSKSGGSLDEIKVGPANAISYGKDLDCAVIQRHGYGYPNWKRYQGGTCAELWIKRSKSSTFELFCKKNMNMIQPIWHNDRVFFISDFQGHGNVYSAAIDGSNLTRHTHCEGFYVRHFTINQDSIIYSQQGQLFQVPIDVNAKNPPKAKHLSIDTGSILHHKTRKYDFSSKTLEDIAPNHNASQVAFCHRGRLFAMPSFQGPALLIDDSSQKRYRHCLWLQDSTRIFAICDDGDIDYPVIFDTKKPHSKPKKWDKLNLGKVLTLSASPSADKVLISNNRHELHLFDIKQGKLTQIAHSDYATISQYDWSSDGNWICYSQQNTHETANIMLYHVDKKTHTTITHGHYHDYSPCFSSDGKYLYFLSQRHLEPKPDAICFQYNFLKTAKAYVCCLDKTLLNPFYHNPKTDDDQADEASKKKKDKDADKDKKKPIHIDTSGIDKRILPFPVDPGNYNQLESIDGKVLFVTAKYACGQGGSDAAGSLSVYDMKELKFEHLFDGISYLILSHDRSFMCYSNAEKQIRIIPAGSKPDEKDDSYRNGGLIDFTRARVAINPESEWPFMLKEAWRLQRDFFWDKDMGQVNWDQILQDYLTVCQRVTTRSELNDLINELHGELGSSHAYIMGGDLPSKRHYQQGLLGANTIYDTKTKSYKIQHIIQANDLSDESLISPLEYPGVDLKVGDLIHAVNGQQLSPSLTPEKALEMLANQYVDLEVTRSSTKKPKKENVIIKASGCNHDRIYRAWVEKNRQYVAKHSNGKLGYIHIPDMSKDGYAEFLRSFLQCFDAPGLVVDVRFNGGGHVSSLILQKLALKRFGLDNARWHNANICYPANSPKGCMVALCNEYAGSDGDMFSYAFKNMKLGQLVGKRTWGGVIGINMRHDLLDGGITSQPEYAIWLDGVGYGVENHGVDPDVVVEITPEQAAKDQDPQLDKAIAIALDELKNTQYTDYDVKLAKTQKPSKQAPKLPQAALIE